MPMQTITGTAAQVMLGGAEPGAVPTAYGPLVVHQQAVNLRLNGKPVRVKFNNSPNIGEGDRLVVSGIEKQGTLDAWAVRNVSTGALLHNPYKYALIASGAVLLFSIPLMFILIGFPLAAIAGYAFFRASRIRSAVQQVSNVPAARAAEA